MKRGFVVIIVACLLICIGVSVAETSNAVLQFCERYNAYLEQLNIYPEHRLDTDALKYDSTGEMYFALGEQQHFFIILREEKGTICSSDFLYYSEDDVYDGLFSEQVHKLVKLAACQLYAANNSFTIDQAQQKVEPVFKEFLKQSSWNDSPELIRVQSKNRNELILLDNTHDRSFLAFRYEYTDE